MVSMIGASFPHPYTMADAHGWIDLVQQGHDNGKPLNFAIARKDDDRLMGCVGLDGDTPRKGNPALGYWLGAPYQGHGCTKAACQLILSYAFEMLAFPKLDIAIGLDNTASLAVAAHLGFEQVEDYKVKPEDNRRGQTDFRLLELTAPHWQSQRS